MKQMFGNIRIIINYRRARDQYGRSVGPEGLHAAGSSRSGEDHVERKFTVTQLRSRRKTDFGESIYAIDILSQFNLYVNFSSVSPEPFSHVLYVTLLFTEVPCTSLISSIVLVLNVLTSIYNKSQHKLTILICTY